MLGKSRGNGFTTQIDSDPNSHSRPAALGGRRPTRRPTHRRARRPRPGGDGSRSFEELPRGIPRGDVRWSDSTVPAGPAPALPVGGCQQGIAVEARPLQARSASRSRQARPRCLLVGQSLDALDVSQQSDQTPTGKACIHSAGPPGRAEQAPQEALGKSASESPGARSPAPPSAPGRAGPGRAVSLGARVGVRGR